MFVTTTAAVNEAFTFIIAICFLLLALIIFFTIFFAVRYRRSRNVEAVDSPGNWKLETAWIAAATVLVIGIFFYGLQGWTYLRNPPADSMKVAVTARQWSWLFTYDNGKKSTSLVVPQGRDVWLSMQSKDVIHGFFIPAYRIKQDIVPGMTNKVWFKAADLGSADILCSEYCGNEHSKMLSKVFVVAPDVYQKWLNGEDVNIPGLTS